MLDKHSTENGQPASEDLRVNTQKAPEVPWTLDNRTHSLPVMEVESATSHTATQVSIPRNGEREKPWTLDYNNDSQPVKKSASVSEDRERERPWTLDDGEGESASIRGRSTTAIASTPEGQADRTNLVGHAHDSPAETEAPVVSSETPFTEPRWSLGFDPQDATNTISRPRSIIGASWVKRSLDHERVAAKYPFDPDDATTFGPFAISNHRNNLIMEVREHTTVPTRVTRYARRLSRALLGREADMSSAQKNDGYYRRPVPEEKGATQTSYRISLAELQRVHLRKLQCKLVKHVVDMRFREMEPAGWEADLQTYTAALKDYDYMLKSSQALRDNFLVTGERLVDDLVIRSMLKTSTCPVQNPICPKPDKASPKKKTKDSETGGSPPAEDRHNDGDLKYFVSVDGPWETADWTVPIGGTRSENRAKSRAMQLQTNGAMAVMGGAFLVCPMWLMVLRESLYLCLITTTGCVVLFGAVMAVMLGEPKDVFSSTAAYAAVLVVFVGLGNA